MVPPLLSPGRCRRPLSFLALAGVVLLSGCGQGGRKPVYPARGQVFDGNNKPAAGALVIFHPVGDDDPNKPRGYVDDKGNFTLTTYEEGDGAPEGEYVVTVEWRPKKKTPYDPEPPDKLQGRYANRKTSRLRATVEKRQQNEIKPLRVP
jgi:hypothetical protein